MTYKRFCECYDISWDAQSPKQRLRRWKRIDNEGYIKERTMPQAICKAPRMKPDSSNPDYCFSELILKYPWRKLDELPSSDEECIRAFGKLSTSDGVIAETLREDVTRAMQLDLLSDASSANAGLSYPAPDWTLNCDLEYAFSNDRDVNTETQVNDGTSVSSKHSYTQDDITRAEDFIAKEVKPFVKTARTASRCDDGADRSFCYRYPVDGPTGLSDDQWLPFGLAMKQSRCRYSPLISGSSCAPLHMIVNGEGATGKSYVIQHIVHDVKNVFTDNANRVLLMAHQGTAAFNIGGETICSALGLGTASNRGFNRDYVPLVSTKRGLQKLRQLQDEYKDVHLIIIDEYSVISCGMLYWINERLNEIFPTSHESSFGGRDVIFVGDPAQLGPITPAALTVPVEKLSCAAQQKGRQLWQEIVNVCQLTSQTRGQSDPEWFDALRRLREMTILPQDLHFFNSRSLQKEEWPDWADRALHIAYRNEDVDRANEECIKRQKEPVLKIEARHQICTSAGNTDPRINEAAIERLMEDASKPNYNRDKEVWPAIHLAVGAPVTLTVNLAQTAGLCNGTRGVIYDFMFKSGDNIPVVLIQITSKYVGPSFFDNIPNIVPIPARTISCGKRSAVMKVSRTGLPLRLAYAMTVHKVQGLTCDLLVCDPCCLPSSTLAYVGLSRVRRREHIVLATPIILRVTERQTEARSVLKAENNRIRVLAKLCRQKAERDISEMKALSALHNNSLHPR